MLRRSAVPLIAVDAVVIDFETTGLDVKTARIVQVAAIPVSGGEARLGQAFVSFVDPGVPIPAAATAVHGIGDRDVAGAPGTAEAIARLIAAIGERVVIGHSVGFDLAILKAECARSGRPFARPRTLDTRLLAEIANPSLPDFSLEIVCEWLAVPPCGRHSALGDARTTAAIFFALAPRLRDRGIRTVAEAERACQGLPTALEGHAAAGWEEPVAPRPPAAAAGEPVALARVDPYPYRHRVADLMTAPPRFFDSGPTLLDAARIMEAERISSLFLPDEGDGAGILTERDVLRAIAADGAPALEGPAARLASRPLATVRADEFVYRALGRMDRLKVRHLGVVDASGRLVGALSARDLLRHRASEAIRIGDAIDQAASPAALAAAWADLAAVAERLLAEEIGVRDIAAIVSSELAAATRQAAVLAQRRMQADGAGTPPVAFAVLVLGSAGRGESLLAMDQDNALVFAEGEPDGAADRYFERLGGIMNDILHEAGVPLCRGGVMARNAAWRGSVATWRERIEAWMRRSSPADLLSVDIFFDLAGVHGEGAMAEELFRFAYRRGSESAAFAKLLAAANGEFVRPLGMFGRMRTENGRIDLKSAGLLPIVASTRVLAVRHNVAERSTAARLRGLIARGVGAETDLGRIAAAHETILRRILVQQVADIDAGLPPGNKVALAALSRREFAELREALAALAHIDAIVRDLLF